MKKTLLLTLIVLSTLMCVNAQTEQLQTGLRKTLEITSNKFEESNHAFIINIIKDNIVVLQIVHGGMIEQIKTEHNEFNFSFNVTFDNEKENQDRFVALEISEDFKYYEWSNIPCFALNAGNDKKKVEEIAIIILNKVYGFDLKDTFEFEIHDQGKI